MEKIAIIGAGGWGTALAITLAARAQQIGWWVFEPELCDALRATRTNDLYLPGFRIPDRVYPTCELSEALERAEIVVTAVPSQHVREIYSRMSPLLDRDQVLISATKGLESATLLRMSEVIHETLRPRFSPRLAVLSGPTFAREVARGSPAAVVIAAEDPGLAASLQHRFSGPAFRLYTNTDVVGVELGGALKNIIAIAAGVCDGLNLGSNTVAALVTRGLSEITRLACACGGRRETLAGLAGLGDLVLTCTGVLSRNRWAGVELGRGKRTEEVLRSTRMVVEGIHTTSAAHKLARQKGVEMPITEQVHAILCGTRSPQDAVRELMERSLKPE